MGWIFFLTHPDGNVPQPDFGKVKELVDTPEFNLWILPNLKETEMVPAENELGTDMNRKFAFPLQLHPRIYSILFLLFASKATKEDRSPVKKACAHINANVCQLFAEVNEPFWNLHCWESNGEHYRPGINFAAFQITNWNFNQGSGSDEVRKKKVARVAVCN